MCVCVYASVCASCTPVREHVVPDVFVCVCVREHPDLIPCVRMCVCFMRLES